MKRISLLSLIIFLSLSAVRGEVKTLEECLALGLPVIYITTDSGEDPSFQVVSAPEGSMGQGCVSEKIPGQVIRYAPDGTEEYNSGKYVKKESGMTIKVRGNTSAALPKKPFKIKLQKKADLLNRGDKKYKDKNWNLINDNMMRNYMGHQLAGALGQEWTPAGEYVNVMFNGDFRGTYLLIEAVEQNQDCRIDVSDTGYIVEHDPYWWNENGEYVPSTFTPSYNYSFKYPDWEDMTETQIKYISEEVLNFEQSVLDGSFDNYIDLDSFAIWYMTHDILGTKDGGGANFFLCKYDDTPTSKFKLMPAWDFDSMTDTPNEWSTPHVVRFPELFNSSNTSFLQKYVDLWSNKGWDTYDKVNDIITDLLSDKWDTYNRSVAETFKRWPESIRYLPTQIAADYFKQWFDARYPWMEEAVDGFALESTPTLVDSPISPSSENNAIYDIYGRKVINPQHGSIYILNGKKYIQR